MGAICACGVARPRGLVNPSSGVILSATKIRAHPENARRNAMKLTQQQIDDFNREGWLFLPE